MFRYRVECSGIESERFGHLLETSVRKVVWTVLVQIEGVVIPPIGALIGHAGGRRGGLHDFGTAKCIVMKLEPDPAGLGVVRNELGFHRTGELFAAWSGEAPSLRYGHRGVLPSH